MKGKYKKGILLGSLFILIAIVIGIIFRHDSAFIFGGIGTIFIGITFLAFINDSDRKNGQK